jgi:hypothetical protein
MLNQVEISGSIHSRIYGQTCDSCGHLQKAFTTDSGLAAYRDDENPITDHDNGLWYLCESCMTPENGEED